jgi:hypothetical protein
MHKKSRSDTSKRLFYAFILRGPKTNPQLTNNARLYRN